MKFERDGKTICSLCRREVDAIRAACERSISLHLASSGRGLCRGSFPPGSEHIKAWVTREVRQ